MDQTSTINININIKEIEDRLLKAKIKILEDSVFFSTILLGLKQEITTKLPTAAVDGITIFYNPDYVDKCSDDELIGLILHEVHHVAHQHTLRRGDRDHKIYNIACDIKIDTDLQNEGYTIPDSLWSDKYDSDTSEQVYDKLIANAKEVPSFGGRMDILEPKPEEAESVQQELSELISQAITAADIKDAGDEVPEGLRASIHELLNPQIEWGSLLQNFMQEISRENYSYSRPNRRYLPDFYLPTQHSPSIRHLVTALDLSGSVSEEEVRLQLTECEYLRELFNLDELTLYGVTTRIVFKKKIYPGESLLDQEIRGYGGTNFKSFFKELEKDPPSVLIFFTDMGVLFDFPVPSFPVLWINTYDDDEAPEEYGQTICIN